MEKLVLALVALAACVCPASAQTQVFVGGNMFADLKRFSGDPRAPTLDGNGVGGGARVGALVAERWSISLAVDLGSSTTYRMTPQIYYPTRLAGSIPSFRSQVSSRLLATSALLGYHGPEGHHVRPAVFGGLTFMHVRRRFDTSYAPLVKSSPASVFLVSPSGAIYPPPDGGSYFPLVVRPYEQVDNVPAATVGVEAAFELTRHFAAVPEVRAHAFGVTGGGSGGFAIRPGLAIRWTF